MHGTTILDLPTELLQKTFDYIDWDHTQHLVPFRPDIIHISLTCRHLRKAVLPVLFRNVTITLRWVNGALAEPGLLRLGQSCPQLIKYVRCVYVATRFGHFRDPKSTMKSFSIMRDMQRWLDTLSSPGEATAYWLASNISKDKVAEELLKTSPCRAFLQNADKDVQANFRDLVYSLSEQVVTTPGVISHGARSSRIAMDMQDVLEEEIIFDDNGVEDRSSSIANTNARNNMLSRDVRFRLDAFFVLLLCFPSRLTSLVFDALPTDVMDLQNKFALELAAQIFKIYGSQLKHLTMKTPLRGAGSGGRRNDEHNPQLEILGPVIQSLDAINHLQLAAQFRSNSSRSMVSSLGHWHAISDRITYLDIRNVSSEAHAIVSFIEKFTNLQVLTLGDFNLSTNPQVARIPRSSSHATFWLSFLIDLRRKLPSVEFDIRDLESSQAKLTESGIRWLLEEAVPIDADVGFDRETRLVEDFESFFPLWEAEDSQRGRDALEARRDGKLVDQAMSSRWRGLPGGGRK